MKLKAWHKTVNDFIIKIKVQVFTVKLLKSFRPYVNPLTIYLKLNTCYLVGYGIFIRQIKLAYLFPSADPSSKNPNASTHCTDNSTSDAEPV